MQLQRESAMRELSLKKNQWSNAEKQWTEFVKKIRNGREPVVRRLGIGLVNLWIKMINLPRP